MSQLPDEADSHAPSIETSVARPRRAYDDPPWRFALGVLVAYVAVGAVCGVLWEWVWTPPAQFVQSHHVYYVDYASLRRVFSGTGLYAVLAAVGSSLVALVVCLLTRRRELLTLGLLVVGSIAAAFVMREVGYALGPPDPTIAAAHAADGTRVQGQLEVTRITPLLVWPMLSLFIAALTFFAWPRSPFGLDQGPPTTTTEADVSGSPQR